SAVGVTSPTSVKLAQESRSSGMQFKSLWHKLRKCLTLVQEQDDMTHIATVLFPLMDKFNYFSQKLHKARSREQYGNMQLNVRRPHVFEDSFHSLARRTGDELKYGKLSVRFYDEEGVYAGGVTREWLTILVKQMLDPNYALFTDSATDSKTYQPNRASAVNHDHLGFFTFCGRVIGKGMF
ncbi:hypothetical protein VP01_7603g1, partial [Puccinia sorghi]